MSGNCGKLWNLYFYCVFAMIILCKGVCVGCEKHLLASLYLYVSLNVSAQLQLDRCW